MKKCGKAALFSLEAALHVVPARPVPLRGRSDQDAQSFVLHCVRRATAPQKKIKPAALMRPNADTARRPRDTLARVFVATSLMLVAACAATVETAPARLGAAGSGEATQQVLTRPASIRFATGYGRELAAGSRWQLVGALPQGAVYKPADTVFSIEGRHVHEAYLVVKAGQLQGFFLPVESAYSPLVPPLPLSLGPTP